MLNLRPSKLIIISPKKKFNLEFRIKRLQFPTKMKAR